MHRIHFSKRKKVRYSAFLVIILFLVNFSIILNFNISRINHGNDLGDDSIFQIRTATFWNLPNIHIDNNWSLTEQTYAWCTGNGTWSNPYVIENVSINAQNSSSGILIENSLTDYFICRNNTLYNSSRGDSWGDAGIRLVNSQRGKLINNNASFNRGSGIFLENSHNNSIIGNILLNNSEQLGGNPSGILLESSDNNTVMMNNVTNNLSYGIQLYYSDNNKVSQNTAKNHNYYGIFLFYSSNNELKYNNISLSKYEGILLYGISDYNVIEENRVSFNSHGIQLRGPSGDNPKYNSIIDNVIYNHSYVGWAYGLNVEEGYNTTITRNEIFNNDDGIRLINSNITLVYDNDIYDNLNYGINIEDYKSSNNILYQNKLYDNANNGRDNGINNTWDNGVIGNYWGDYGGNDKDDDGIGDITYNIMGTANNNDTLPIWDDGFNGSVIIIDDTSLNNWEWAEKRFWCEGSGTINDPYVISGLIIDAQDAGTCIEIRNSIKYFSIERNAFINSSGGYTEAGIKLNNVTNGQIIGNDVSDINYIGIYLLNSNFNLIEGNNASYITDLGIWLVNSDNNSINKNIVNNSPQNAIEIDDDSDLNNITSNTVNGNQKGIVIYGNSDYNYIFNNTVKFNTIADGVGINILDTCMNNTIFNNLLVNNSKGIQIQLTTSNGNMVYYNTFINNTLSASDDGINKWYSGTTGNYWDDYNGEDLNDDGIGDTPYNITGLGGSNDNYPIWDDGDSIQPEITITDPVNYTYHNGSPVVQTIFYDLNGINQSWYWVVGSSENITFTGNSVGIDGNKWLAQGEGLVYVIFFANDSSGNLGSKFMVVNKDTTLPDIVINSPISGAEFGTIFPGFNLTVTDINLEQLWYTIDSGADIVVSTSSGINIISLSQTVWDSLTEGLHTINFFANDTAGNEFSIGIDIIKALPSSAGPAIPLGNFYLIFIGIAITALIMIERKKKNRSPS
ncbi:hypothetical protein LCGC14_0697550 [marine sediment metagenome]|uniref:Periplasmic copper-binding protein NosD beta helix domain-containing protein n=1 Tax=marine sediment metagenome TaxID=412755 RepID=A0A0F9QNI5_9ZZZZ